jgi:hypothetical protein
MEPSREVCRPAAIPVTCSAQSSSGLVALFLVLSFPPLVSCGPPRPLRSASFALSLDDLDLAIAMVVPVERLTMLPLPRSVDLVVEAAFQQAEVDRDDRSSYRTIRRPTEAYAGNPVVNVLMSSV